MKKVNAHTTLPDEPEQIPEVEQEQVTVRLLTTKVYEGRYLVYDPATLDTYLVGAEHLLYDMGDQTLGKDVLLSSERPYAWDNEIQALAVSPAQIRLALHFTGHLVQEEMNFKKLVVSLLTMGVVPVLKSEERNNG
jgi:hypothetical protein